MPLISTLTKVIYNKNLNELGTLFSQEVCHQKQYPGSCKQSRFPPPLIKSSSLFKVFFNFSLSKRKWSKTGFCRTSARNNKLIKKDWNGCGEICALEETFSLWQNWHKVNVKKKIFFYKGETFYFSFRLDFKNVNVERKGKARRVNQQTEWSKIYKIHYHDNSEWSSTSWPWQLKIEKEKILQHRQQQMI